MRTKFDNAMLREGAKRVLIGMEQKLAELDDMRTSLINTMGGVQRYIATLNDENSKLPEQVEHPAPTSDLSISGAPVKRAQIIKIIISKPGRFGKKDIELDVAGAFPQKKIIPNSVSQVLLRLHREGHLKIVQERSGRVGAIYETLQKH